MNMKLQNFTIRSFNNVKFWTGIPNTWRRQWSVGILPALPAFTQPSRSQQTPVCIP